MGTREIIDMKLHKTRPKAKRFKPVRFIFMSGLFEFRKRTDLDEWARMCKTKDCVLDPTEFGAIEICGDSTIKVVVDVNDAYCLRP